MSTTISSDDISGCLPFSLLCWSDRRRFETYPIMHTTGNDEFSTFADDDAISGVINWDGRHFLPIISREIAVKQWRRNLITCRACLWRIWLSVRAKEFLRVAWSLRWTTRDLLRWYRMKKSPGLAKEWLNCTGWSKVYKVYVGIPLDKWGQQKRLRCEMASV